MCEQLKRIFDSSACLSRRQLKDYVSGQMSREEEYAAEYHVNTCLLCSEALDGLGKKASVLIFEELDANFLEDHFSLINPQIHLNSIAPSMGAQPVTRVLKKKNNAPLLKPTSILSALILAFAVLWYLDYEKPAVADNNQRIIEVQSDVANQQVVPLKDVTPESAQTIPQSQVDEQIAIPTGSEDNQHSNKQQAFVATEAGLDEQVKASTDTHLTRTETPEKQALVKTTPVPNADAVSKGDHDVKSSVTSSDKTMNEEKKLPSEKILEEKAEPDLREADELFNAGKHQAALPIYKKQMNTSGGRDAQYSTLQAARCYLNLGKKDAAVKLLQSLSEEGSGASKRQARRLLRELSD